MEGGSECFPLFFAVGGLSVLSMVNGYTVQVTGCCGIRACPAFETKYFPSFEKFPKSGFLLEKNQLRSRTHNCQQAAFSTLQGLKMKKSVTYIGAICISAMLCGCQATGEKYGANVYRAGEVNTQQNAKTVEILAVMPARIEVDNKQQKQAAQVFGALLGAVAGAAVGHSLGDQSGTNTAIGAAGGAGAGAAAGSLVSDTALVDGVSIAYKSENQVYNSAQVGKVCEFAPGTAIMISAAANETRIQPNAVCPVAAKQEVRAEK